MSWFTTYVVCLPCKCSMIKINPSPSRPPRCIYGFDMFDNSVFFLFFKLYRFCILRRPTRSLKCDLIVCGFTSSNGRGVAIIFFTRRWKATFFPPWTTFFKSMAICIVNSGSIKIIFFVTLFQNSWNPSPAIMGFWVQIIVVLDLKISEINIRSTSNHTTKIILNVIFKPPIKFAYVYWMIGLSTWYCGI